MTCNNQAFLEKELEKNNPAVNKTLKKLKKTFFV